MAVISPCGSLSYAGLQARVSQTERTLRRLLNWPSPAKQPRIGLDAPNGTDYIILALAILKSGACFVPIASELTLSEQQELIERTSLHAVIRAQNADDWHLELIQLQNSTEISPAFDSLNAAFIRFSSGTTAQSKGVVISHETLLARITAANEALRISPADCVLWVLPMAHHFAVSIILYLYHGATTLLAPSTDPAMMLCLMRKHGATVIYGSPYHYTLLASQPDAAAMQQLRLVVSTAFALNQEVAGLFYSKTRLHITQALGVIEVGLPLINLEHAATYPTSVGKPTPCFEAKLEDGELLLRGPGLFDAYVSPWQSRETALRQGWFPTGDIAEINEKGYFFLKGRSQSVINVGGMKCFPEEVESVLNSHPLVKSARVFARPHPVLGHVPVAELITQNQIEDTLASQLKKICQQRLSAYKVPLVFTFVNQLPMTASGKMKRY
ncbi:MAG: class I adenylate-forming enzyme family protein [Prosthecobacter sp.]